MEDVREKLVELLDNFHRDLSPFAGNEKLFVVDDNVEQAEYLIAHGVTVQKWISVKDRLPGPTENPVLVPYAGSVWTAWRHADYWELGGLLNTVCVTHWMPLPHPPKGE